MSRLRWVTAVGGTLSVLAATVFGALPPIVAAGPSGEPVVSAGVWNKPVQVSRHVWVGYDVGIATDGTTAAVWSTRRGVTARVWTRDEGWRPPVRLGAGFDPDLSVNGRGAMAAVWWKPSRDQYLLRVSRRPAGGTWTRPVTLYRGTPAYGTDVPDVSVGPEGKVTVAVSISRRYFQVPSRPLVFTYTAGRWGPAVELTRKFGSSVRVATGPEGDRTVAWVRSFGSWCAAHSDGGSWSRPVCRVKPRSYGSLGLDVDSGGRAYLMTFSGVWSSQGGGSWRREPVPGGLLGAFDSFNLDVDASAPGRAAIVWSKGRYIGRSRVIFTMFASTRRLDGTWTRRARLSKSSEGAVGISGSGTAYVAWRSRTGRLRVTRMEPGQPWSRPAAKVPGRRAGAPELVVNHSGVGVVLFPRGHGDAIESASLWAARRPG